MKLYPKLFSLGLSRYICVWMYTKNMSVPYSKILWNFTVKYILPHQCIKIYVKFLCKSHLDFNYLKKKKHKYKYCDLILLEFYIKSNFEFEICTSFNKKIIKITVFYFVNALLNSCSIVRNQVFLNRMLYKTR